VGAIFVVRHGQAAFGTDDYDRLTDLGFRQARLLGQYFGARGLAFDAVFTGTLRRQRETAQGILEGHSPLGAGLEAERFAGLDEYNPEAILRAYTGNAPVTLAERDPVVMREHFRLLREALIAWSEDRTQPEGMPAFQAFQQGAVAALTEARQRFADGNVLIVSSGGPIGALVADTLKAPPVTAVDLNLRIRNASLSEFSCTARRHQLICYNAIPHLEMAGDPKLVTYT
jgi:broad specificity phosphatase PhoE